MDQDIMRMLFRVYNMYLEEARWAAQKKADMVKTKFPNENWNATHFYKPSFEGFMKWVGEKLDEHFTFQY